MDFSSQIKNCKKLLKPTKTIITNYVGEKFEINPGNSMKKLGQGFPFVVDEKPDLQVIKITSGVFLSSQDSVFSLEILIKNNIKNILSLGISPDIKFDGINYYFIEILDIPEFKIEEVIYECLEVIKKNKNEGILVHCNAGVSRSPTVIIAYLMEEENLTFQETFDRVKSLRACIKPNEGFIKQLKEFETRKRVKK